MDEGKGKIQDHTIDRKPFARFTNFFKLLSPSAVYIWLATLRKRRNNLSKTDYFVDELVMNRP